MVSTNDFMLMVGREVGAKIGVCPSSPYKNHRFPQYALGHLLVLGVEKGKKEERAILCLPTYELQFSKNFLAKLEMLR